MPIKKTRTHLPKVGDRLSATYKGSAHVATVVAVDRSAGHVHVRVGSELFRSLSAAAKSITGNWVNGWVFWGLEERV